jgi:response regulator RpfG family c-di-GMP phosphodiesterase
MEKTLLIVDDNKEIIDIVSEILSDLFDKIMTAGTVDEAQKVLQENTFSFVILDINLEGRNGAEVIKFLVDTDNPNKSCPFVILSGIITPQFIQKHNQRFAGILMKPFEHSELLDIVENILNDKQPAARLEELPYIKCDLPFPIVQLEQRVSKVMEGVRKNNKLRELFAQMKIDRSGDNYMMTHIGMLINISTGICIQLEWNTDKTLEKFVYAAYLHDMALSDRPDLAKLNTSEELEAKKATLSEYDYKLVLEHPNIADRSLEGMREIPPDVQMIVKQHHELPKGTGFPTKMTYQKISPLSTVFIVAQDLTEHILANPKWSMENYLKEAKSKFKGTHFIKVLSALDSIK